MGSFGEGAKFFGEFGLARPGGAWNGEMVAERGDIFRGFRLGIARGGEIFSCLRAVGSAESGGALRWRGAARLRLFVVYCASVGVVRMGGGRYTRRD